MGAYKKTLILLALLFAAIAPVLGQSALSVSITAENNGVICAGNSINLTASVTGGVAPYTFLWSDGETTSTINVNKAGTYTVTVSDNTAGGQPVKQSVSVTSVAAPAAPTAQSVIVCKGNTATLQATAPGGTYQWYDSNGIFLATGDTYTTGAINSTTFFYVEATVSSCTGPRSVVNVTLSGNPTTTNANICAGNTATVTASGGDSYTWYDAPNGNVVGQGPSFITGTLTATTTYYVVAIINGCASAPIAATVNVTPYPQTPVPTFTSINICSGTSANLHADVSNGGTISWYSSSTGGTPLIISPDYSTPNLTVSTTYYAESASGECVSPRVAVTVNVTPPPAAPTVTPGNATACNGTSAVLTATSASGGTFAWYADAAGTTPLPNNTANPFTTPVLTATTTYYVQAVNNGCVSELIPVTITVTDPPPPPTVAPVSQPCPGTAATLQAIAPGGTYSWYDAATGGNLLFTGDTFTPMVSANTTYYVQVTDATTGCTGTRTAVPVTVLPAATPPSANPVTICYNNSATLTATGSDNYQWYNVATGGTALASGSTFTTGFLTANATYYVETVINGCISARTAVTVTVTPVPQQPTVSGTATICPGTSTPLSASVSDGGTIKWYNVATGGTALFTGNNYSPTVNATTTFYAEDNLGACGGTRAGVTVTTTPVNFPLFQYASATICNTAGTITPTVNPPGGTFTASPATLIINNTTGVINATLSPLGKYTVTFKSNNSCQTISQVTISIVVSPDAAFSYSGAPYCQFGTPNPAPTFTGTASAGVFTATPSGLVIDPNTGVIDLQKSAPGTYDITNTIAANGTCPQAAYTVTGVVINPGVTINAGPDQSIKSGNTAQLAGSVTASSGATGAVWTGGTGTFSDPNIPNPVYTPGTGETSATLTLTTTTGTTCGVISDQVKITIIPKPANPTVAQPPATCPGSTVVLKATAPGGTYEWFTVATGGTKIFTGDTFTTPQLNVSTTYYVQVTNITNNTSDRTQVDVTINPSPAAPTASSVSTCFNTPATLTASGSPGTYAWYATAFGGTPLSTTATYTTPALTGNTSYYVQAISSAGCAGPRTKVDVTITRPPAFTSSGTGQVCSGSTFSYSATTDVAATFSWSRQAVTGISNPVASGTSGSISETLINITANPVKVTYVITATSAQNCSSVLNYVVTVNPFGTVTNANKESACNGTPLNYTPAFNHPGVSYKWSRAAVAGILNAAVDGQAAATIKESLYNTTNAPIDVTYTFSYAEGSCNGSFDYIVSVGPGITITSANYTEACAGQPLNYSIVSNVPSATFTWDRQVYPNINNPAVVNQTGAVINEALINNSSSIAYSLYVITPSINGCQGTPFNLFVGVHPIPSAPSVNSNSPVCEGNTILLQTPTIAGATYLWTGPNGFSSSEQNPQITNATQANAGTYSLSIILNNCPGPVSTADIKINILPKVTVGPDQVVCVTQNTINLTGTVSGGTTTGIWTTNGTGTFSPSAGQLNAQYLPSAQDKLNGTVSLTLTSTSKDDCSPATGITVITFGPTPAVDAGTDLEACAQSHAIPLNGKLLKPGSAVWSSSGTGFFVPSANVLTASYIPSVADSLKGSVTLTLSYNNASVCDIASDDINIKLIPPPTVYAGGTRYVLKDETIVLQPTVSDENVQYLWTPNIGLSSNTIKNPVVTGGNSDKLYTLTITDSRGCTSQDQALVKVSPVINVNNTFTPNGDGVNDQWTITGLVAYVNADINVYNRLGKLLYHTIGYNKPWDGTYNGQQLPVGTYYYVIRLNANEQVLSGSVTIIR